MLAPWVMWHTRVHVATIRGIPIHLHLSWILIYALITWTLAGAYFPHAVPGISAEGAWGSGLLAALLLFTSVLLHELSHSLVALKRGMRVGGITLHVFGGVSELEDEPATPGTEARIAVVGPLTSLALAAVLWACTSLGLVSGVWARALVEYLLVVNLALGIFNLVPGFPLDGGRLLRAGLWRVTGSLTRATRIASRVGVAFAYVLMAAGILEALMGALTSGVWLVLIGVFLRQASEQSYAQVVLRGSLEKLRVDDAMTRDVATLPVDASAADLAKSFALLRYGSFPVVDDGTVRGIVRVDQVHDLPADRWAGTSVRQLMEPLTDELTIAPGQSLFDALHKVSRNGLGRLAVLDGHRLVGYLSQKDVTQVLVRHGLADGSPVVPQRWRDGNGPGAVGRAA